MLVFTLLPPTPADSRATRGKADASCQPADESQILQPLHPGGEHYPNAEYRPKDEERPLTGHYKETAHLGA